MNAIPLPGDIVGKKSTKRACEFTRKHGGALDPIMHQERWVAARFFRLTACLMLVMSLPQAELLR